MNISLSGANGFVGKNVAEELRKNGYEGIKATAEYYQSVYSY